MEIFLREYGETLGVDKVKRQFVVYGKDRSEKLRLPVHRVDYINITSGNKVTTNALFWASMYGIDVMMLSDTGKPVSLIVPVDFQKMPENRISQYKTSKGFKISKAIIKKKLQNHLDFLKHFGYPSNILESCLLRIEEAKTIRTILTIEAKASREFFTHYFKHLNKGTLIREKRGARDPINNLLNLGYELLKAEVVKGIYRYHLDPYFGFLHTPNKSKPALACDLMEPYRIFIEIFVSCFIERKIDFQNDRGRSFLNRRAKLEFIREFNRFLDQKIRLDKKFKNIHERLTIRNLIRDESSRLSMYLRGEKIFTPLENVDWIDFKELEHMFAKVKYTDADWTREEIEALRKLHPKKTYNEISKKIGKTPKAIERKAEKLRLKKKYRKWNKKDEKFLRENLGEMSITGIAKRLKRPKSLVHYRKHQLLSKNLQFS
jgi:CRISPR-associated protein Cas1